MKHTGMTALFVSLWLAVIVPGAAPAGERETGAGPQIQQVSETMLRDVFTKYLCKHLRKPETDVAVSRFKVSGDTDVPAGPLTLSVFQKERGTLSGHVRLAALVAVAGIPRTEVTLSGWVDVFEPAVCTTRPIKKGEILEREDLYLVRRNVSRLQGSVINEVDRAAGLMAKHNLRENACLRDWMVEKAPALDKGDVVTILARLGGLHVSVRGMVLERGYPGEMVKVQNMMTQKTVLARVIDGSNVMVEF